MNHGIPVSMSEKATVHLSIGQEEQGKAASLLPLGRRRLSFHLALALSLALVSYNSMTR